MRIAVTPGLGISPVPRILQVFRGLRPRVPVVVHTADSATICKWVSSGYYELGLAGYVALPQEVDTELVHSERAVCIVPRGHRLARKRKVVPSDLAGESFISFASSDVVRVAIDRVFDPEVRRLEIETSLATAACAMVARGLGVSIVNPAMLSELALAGVHALAFEPAIHLRMPRGACPPAAGAGARRRLPRGRAHRGGRPRKHRAQEGQPIAWVTRAQPP